MPICIYCLNKGAQCYLQWGHKSILVHKYSVYFIYLSLCDDKFSPCTGFRIPESGKFFSWNSQSWALESEIHRKEWGITLTIGIPNPSPTDKDWNPVQEIWNPQHRIQNPRLSWIFGEPRVSSSVLFMIEALNKAILWRLFLVSCKQDASDYNQHTPEYTYQRNDTVFFFHWEVSK